MKYYAIIVAGGSGNRMQNVVAKQFLLLNGKPVLMHTLEAFHQCVLNPEIILVLNIHQHSFWKQLCYDYNFNVPHQIINGGAQRYHSVKSGLDSIPDEGIVAVHDAVRPLVTTELIAQCYEVAKEKGNAIVGLSPTDSVRKIIEGKSSKAIARGSVMLIQTPQVFKIDILKQSYLQDFKESFTDDASVAECAGYDINVIPGERTNIKITYPEDLETAALILNKRGF
jgi:2-C-methyl-D-erythritol 4-phosphate cytidylyltransferase